MRDAALRGVRVRLLVDDLYTIGGDELFIGLAAFPNVEVRLFNPFCCGRGSLLGKYTASLFDFSRLNHRMHNKLFIADSAMVVAGGRNIADEYFMRHTMDNFLDVDAFVVGAVVSQLAMIFDGYWNSNVVYPASSIIPSTLDRGSCSAFQRDVGASAGSRAARRAMARRQRRPGRAQRPRSRSRLPPKSSAISRPAKRGRSFPIDILGYGPIRDDIESGQLGLIWARASAFADSPLKVIARSDEEALAMSVSMNVMDRVIASKEEVVLVSPYFIPGRDGRRCLQRAAPARRARHGAHQLARVERRTAGAHGLRAIPDGAAPKWCRPVRDQPDRHSCATTSG